MRNKLRYIFIIVLAFNLINTLSWIDINSTDKSIQKIEDMLLTDQAQYYKLNLPAEECLAINYERNGLQELGLIWYKTAFEKYWKTDPRIGYNYAMALLRVGDKQGIELLRWITVNFPEYQLAQETLKSFNHN